MLTFIHVNHNLLNWLYLRWHDHYDLKMKYKVLARNIRNWLKKLKIFSGSNKLMQLPVLTYTKITGNAWKQSDIYLYIHWSFHNETISRIHPTSDIRVWTFFQELLRNSVRKIALKSRSTNTAKYLLSN